MRNTRVGLEVLRWLYRKIGELDTESKGPPGPRIPIPGWANNGDPVFAYNNRTWTALRTQPRDDGGGGSVLYWGILGHCVYGKRLREMTMGSLRGLPPGTGKDGSRLFRPGVRPTVGTQPRLYSIVAWILFISFDKIGLSPASTGR